MSRAAVLFAQGLEECEGLIVVDLLRRAKIMSRYELTAPSIIRISDNMM